MTSGFPEEQLVQNRAAVLLFGGGEADRLAWAEESALRLREDGALTTLTNEAELAQLLLDGRRVLLIPDIAAVSQTGQMLLVKTLLEREDRPKIIVGLGIAPMDARLKGKLRDDLAYRLQVSQVDLSQPGTKTLLRERRAKLEREIERRHNQAERAAKDAARQAKAAARALDKPAAPQPRPKPVPSAKAARPAAKKKAKPAKARAVKKSKPAKKARR